MYFYDKIYGSIEITDLAKSIIDTSEFQRLRRIHQTGVLLFLFPSANHTRFEHSIGVYHLARTFTKNLLEDYYIKNKNRLIELIGIAGLVHDLGHLAFSHLFESFLKNQNIKFNHEELSQILFRYICDKYKLNITKDEIEMIIQLIHPKEKWIDGFIWCDENIGTWIFQIVANPINGLDVDKFDYLVRDSMSCGFNVKFDCDRIIKMSKIIENQLVYPWKLRYNLFEVFLTRYQLHQQLYKHKTVKGIELVIIKILEELNNTYNFQNKIKNLEILELTDNIIYQYNNPIIKKLLEKIETRQFPKISLKKEATILIKCDLGYTNERNNPLLNIKYFDKHLHIINPKIKDYGILASNTFHQTISLYFK